jgi:predicted secreted protein
MAIINGSDLMLFVASGNNTVKSVAYATNHTLTISTSSSEISNKDVGGGLWNESTIQKISWSANTENMYSLDGEGITYDDLFDIMASRELVTVQFGLESGYQNKVNKVPTGGWSVVTSGKYTGKALISDLSLNAPDGSKATFTCSLSGVGPLTKV